MSPILLVAAAGAALLLWPRNDKQKDPSPFTSSTQTQAHPTYQATLSAMAAVRLRLLQTQALDEKAKAAIDVLTLSLVAGSDQE